MESNVYNKKGETVGKIKVPENIFDISWNADLVSQTINSIKSTNRAGTADTKGRGDVRGGGKKPWKQKGTGRARHGSIRSPIWVGGGVAHGPKAEKNYDRKTNKKAKLKTLFTILSAKYRDGEILFVDDLSMSGIKTKNASDILKNLSKIKGYEKINYKKGNRALIYLPKKDDNTVKSFRNISATSVEEARNIDPVSAISYKYIVISNPEESLKILSGRA